MNLGLHIDHYTTGRYGFAGSIPLVLMQWREATRADVLANRPSDCYRTVDGTRQALYSPTFATLTETRQHVIDNGCVDLLCKSETCACHATTGAQS